MEMCGCLSWIISDKKGYEHVSSLFALSISKSAFHDMANHFYGIAGRTLSLENGCSL